MPLRQWIRSANFAIEGVMHAARTQKHLRYHFYIALVVLLLSYALGITRIEFLIIALSVIAVLLSEMFNTAIENLVDILSPAHSEKARIVKDIAAGAVLVTALGAAIIGYIILFPYIDKVLQSGLYITRHPKGEVAVVAFVILLIIVLIAKTLFGKGHPLKGGMPSGHSALAFSAWISVTFITENTLASILCFCLAMLIAQSRITIKVHSRREVILGALIGSVTTFLLFKILA
jgi:diacylglycerol kinase (ATP)